MIGVMLIPSYGGSTTSLFSSKDATMYNTHQLGFSLLESLMALALVSGFCVSVMQWQLRLVQHTKRVYYEQLAMRTQHSLAERLRSCLGNVECQQHEMRAWQSTSLFSSAHLHCHIMKNANACTSTLRSPALKVGITFQFQYV